MCHMLGCQKSLKNPLIFLNDDEVMRFSEMVRMKGNVSRSKRVVFNFLMAMLVYELLLKRETEFVSSATFDYPRSSIKISSRLMTYLDIPELNSGDDIAAFCILWTRQILDSYRERSKDILL